MYPGYAALALMALIDGSEDDDLRFDGALLIASMAQDIHFIKRAHEAPE